MIRTTKTYPIHMTKGDTLSFGIKITGLDQNLDSAYFTCATRTPNITSVTAFQKSLGDGISKVGDGEYAVRVAPEDTENLPVDLYSYDLQIGVNDDIFTLIKGILYLEEEVTK